MIKNELCAAFCEGLDVVEVPVGYAVGTSFKTEMGDNLAFYVCGPDADGLWRLQDDGTTIPVIEALGADLSIPARREAFEGLLAEYGASFDEGTQELKSATLDRSDVAVASMQFVALLLRIQDLALLSTDRVASTWVEEATTMLQTAVGGKAELVLKSSVHPEFEEFPADAVLTSMGRSPVALFFGVSDTKVYEALLLQSYAKQAKKDCEVIVLLEEDGSVTRKARQRADNHLIVPRFKGGKTDAIGRIVEVATGQRPGVLH